MGRLELIVGCMFAGKTDELIRRIHRERVFHGGDASLALFKPGIDDRYGSKPKIITHDKKSLACRPISNSRAIQDYLQQFPQVSVVGIDEVQFLDGRIIDLCLYLRSLGKHLIVSGLNTDFRGKPFRFQKSKRHVGDLMAYADQVTTLSALCTHLVTGRRCGEQAYYTQRLFADGRPVPYRDPLVFVGNAKTHHQRRYEARCFQHHFVPGRPW